MNKRNEWMGASSTLSKVVEKTNVHFDVFSLFYFFFFISCCCLFLIPFRLRSLHGVRTWVCELLLLLLSLIWSRSQFSVHLLSIYSSTNYLFWKIHTLVPGYPLHRHLSFYIYLCWYFYSRLRIILMRNNYSWFVDSFGC